MRSEKVRKELGLHQTEWNVLSVDKQEEYRNNFTDKYLSEKTDKKI